ncbi:sigma-70 family RNA polymerase sigma factor [Streptosporangium sp. NPDC051023]|uniref:sigma-70 family RNA polymerase sigma factor n=1 Tax=Streptosporangium sp. NPDC051023 TaxID=3155410 RepID=UPI00344EB273
MTATHTSDETLVKEYLAGNPNAFATLYARYAAPIAGYLYNRCPGISRDEQNDLVQEVFTETLALLPEFREDDYSDGNAFRQWLYNIPASNVLFQYRKRYWRHREAWLRSVDEVAQQIHEALFTRDAGPGLPERVRTALERLRPHYREAVELYYLEGQQHQTIATIMGRDSQSVRHLIRAALADLRDPDRAKMVRGERRAALLAGARTLLTERDARKITGGDIAKAAGCAEGLIRYYFGSKQALLAEAAQQQAAA